MKNKIRIFGLLSMLLIGVIALSGFANAIPASVIKKVTVEGVTLDETGVTALGLEKNDEIGVKIEVMSDADLSDVQVEAVLRGYDHPDLIQDITDVFDMKANVVYKKELNLNLPIRMDQDRYKLRIRVSDRASSTAEKTYELEIDTKRHAVEIRDIVLSPENEVKAGRALLASVRIKNRGESKEQDIKVRASIPALGISASGFIDELDAETGEDDSTTSEELYMQIPKDAETGEYTVKVEVIYDDGDEKETKTATIRVLGEELAVVQPETQAKTIITVGPESQDVVVGSAGASYPITLTNAGTASRTYTVSVDGAGWANVAVSPSNTVVIEAGESKALYVTVQAAAGAPVGEQMFAVTVSSGDKVLKQVPLKANVVSTGGVSSKLKRALEIGLVVLVILLVILGLIIGFNKLKGSEEEGKEEGSQTYY